MGTTGRVVVVGGRPSAGADAVARIADLERRWSRFRPDSELSRLNARAGRGPVVVSNETAGLVTHAVQASALTGGAFDPTVLAALIGLGYDAPFPKLPVDRLAGDHEPAPAPGCRDIHVDPAVPAVSLPDGVALDPGGIGKGLAADIVAEELLAGGADGALVDLGGDIRVAGRGPADGAWVIDVEDPRAPGRSLLHLAVRDAGVATSSRLRRRWRVRGQERHHLVDPRTGRSAETPFVTATVIAGTAWWSEALTKAVLVTGDLRPVRHTASAVAVDEAGVVHATADLEGVGT